MTDQDRSRQCRCDDIADRLSGVPFHFPLRTLFGEDGQLVQNGMTWHNVNAIDKNIVSDWERARHMQNRSLSVTLILFASEHCVNAERKPETPSCIQFNRFVGNAVLRIIKIDARRLYFKAISSHWPAPKRSLRWRMRLLRQASQVPSMPRFQ